MQEVRHWARTNGAFNGSLRQNGANAQRTSALKVTYEASGIGSCLVAIYTNEHPPRGFVAQIVDCRDSWFGSSMIAGAHEQTCPADLPHKELA